MITSKAEINRLFWTLFLKTPQVSVTFQTCTFFQIIDHCASMECKESQSGGTGTAHIEQEEEDEESLEASF